MPCKYKILSNNHGDRKIEASARYYVVDLEFMPIFLSFFFEDKTFIIKLVYILS